MMPASRTAVSVATILDEYIDEATVRTPAAAALWREVRRAARGGKQIRPRLLLAVHRSLGGGDEDTAARVAAGFELLHTAFLIHDDVIDHDWIRRGAPTVAATFRTAALSHRRRPDIAEHFGISAAIIAGDLAVAGAVDLIVRAPADAEIRSKLSEIVSGAVSATAAGELMDVELASGEQPALDAVLAMYEAKTSVSTFCAPLQAGAVLARAHPEVVAALGRAGLALGVAYQVTDDLLGTSGDPESTRKSSSSDARAGKVTALAALAMRNGIDPDAASGGTAPDRVGHLRSAIEVSGARDAAVRLAAEKIRDAQSHLAALPAALREAIQPVLAGLLDRVA